MITTNASTRSSSKKAPHSQIYYEGEDLTDDTELWRYMRLSMLLVLLDGEAFIPTIEKLRADDPTEATTLCPRTTKRFQSLTKEDRKCLLACAPEKAEFMKANPQIDASPYFSAIWGHEIGKRRCAWCWHAADIESMAQWHIYAKDGVAIRSTPRQIRMALGDVVDSGVIGRVQYGEGNQSFDESAFMRPYLIKSRCYAHEKEVRVVLPRTPIDHFCGLKLRINGHKLISGIRISPLLPLDEANSLRDSLHEIVNRKKGKELDDMNRISVQVSAAKRKPDSHLENVNFFQSQQNSVARFGRFGKDQMPQILSEDMLRGFGTTG